jgi:thiol-disulfide isomerase/thioredoxin
MHPPAAHPAPHPRRRNLAAGLALAPVVGLGWASRAQAQAAEAAPPQGAETPAVAQKPEAPQTFELTTPLGKNADGQMLTLADMAGRALIVCFWASWCPHCRSELPALERIQHAVSPEQLRVLLINTEPVADWRRLRRSLEGQMRSQLTNDADGRAGKAFGAPGSVPYTVVVGRDGRRQATLRGWSADRLDWLIEHANAALAAPAR